MTLTQFFFDKAQSCPRTHPAWKLPRALCWQLARRLGGDVYYKYWRSWLLLPLNHALPAMHEQSPQYGAPLALWANAVNSKRPSAPMIDVGANIGDTAAIMRSVAWASPILAIEASERYFRYLLKNAPEIRRLDAQRAFLGREADWLPGQLAEHHGTAEYDGTAPGKLRVVTLPQVLADHPDFRAAKLVKTDCDGLDPQVILGALDWIEAARPVLYVEWHPWGWAGLGDGREMLAALRALGYRRMAWYAVDGRRICVLDTDSPTVRDLTCYVTGPDRMADVVLWHEQDEDVWEAAR